MYYTNKNAIFQLCKSSGFRDMTLTNMGKRSFFDPTQHIKTIITLVLLGAESWLIPLFKALMQLYNMRYILLHIMIIIKKSSSFL